MRRKGFVLLFGLVLAGMASGASAQVLPSTPVGPGYVMLSGEGDQFGDLQFSVDVVGKAPRLSGAAGDHFLTFSTPIQVPGAFLEEGTYVFRLVTPSVMQVVSADRTRSRMFMVTPIQQLERSAAYKVVLRPDEERPMRLAALYVPDSRKGFEPVYGPPSSCERILRDMGLPTTRCFE